MQLILNTYGTTLRVKDGLFLIIVGDKQQEIAPKKVSSLLLTTGVFLSTDSIKLSRAMETCNSRSAGSQPSIHQNKG